MRTRLKVLAVVAGVLAAGTSSVAMAKYPCAPGYRYHNRVCQPIWSPGYSNPVSGAVSGEAAGAAKGGCNRWTGRCGRRRGARHRERSPYRHRQYALGSLVLRRIQMIQSDLIRSCPALCRASTETGEAGAGAASRGWPSRQSPATND